MVKRKKQWGAVHVPHIRREMVRHEQNNTTGDIVNAAVVIAVETGTLFWSAKEVTGAALDASQSLPESFEGMAPADQGVMLLEKPLPDIPVNIPGSSVPQSISVGVDGVAWGLTGYGLIVAIYARSDRLPPNVNVGLDKMANLGGASINCDRDGHRVIITSENLEKLNRDSVGHITRWLFATWGLMREPRVVQARDMDTATGGSTTPASDPMKKVQVLNIRPPVRRPGNDIDPKTGREYRHQWIVRGHWRNQAVGKKHGQRELTWIPAYVKGPEGAPMKVIETVWSWSE